MNDCHGDIVVRGLNAEGSFCSSYTGDYALPDSDPIRIEDLHVERAPCKAVNGRAGKHAVSAPTSNSGKRKSGSTAVVDTKRRRSSAPDPAAANTGQARQSRATRAAQGLLGNHKKGASVGGGARNGGAAGLGATLSDMKGAKQQFDLNEHHVVQETPEDSIHEDLGHTGAKSARAVVQQENGVLVPELEVQQLRERALLTGRLESEVASLQQTLQERVQHANKSDEQVAALKRQVGDLQAALAREQACVREAHAARAAALQRESDCQRRFNNAAQQSEEELSLIHISEPTRPY